MDEVAPCLRSAGFSVAELSYGEFSIGRFLSFPFFRRKALARLRAGIDDAYSVYRYQNQERYPRLTSIISHSFGTWLVLTLLMRNPGIQLSRLIVCGSVIKEDYDLGRVLKQFSVPMLNEIGTKDYWPALAESVGWGYGSIGATGMHHAAVTNRWHKNYRHSDFLTADFCRKFWIPFLIDVDNIVPGDKAQKLPFWITLITTLPLRWLILSVFGLTGVWLPNTGLYAIGGIDVFKTTSCYWAAKYFINYWISHC
jgi:pimeloyl-ACP methyl ester carboxylesterase